MRAVVKNSAEHGVEYVTDYSDPKPADGHVVIEVAAASLCGTDREVYEWTPSAQAFALDLPVVTGHEGSGTVIEVGHGVTGLRVGDRVALESHLVCAQYMAAPQEICVKLPDHASLEVGALLEAAGVAVHAVQRASYEVAGRAVLVGGGGPVRLVVAYLATQMGAAHVIVVEPNPYRRAQAEKIG